MKDIPHNFKQYLHENLIFKYKLKTNPKYSNSLI